MNTPTPPLWKDRNKTPSRKGWYITRREDGVISWRAWGNGGWWKQLKGGGWIEWFDGDGAARRFDWQSGSRQSIDLDTDKLPDLANTSFAGNIHADNNRLPAELTTEREKAERYRLASLKLEAELTTERARLDWLESPAGMDWQWQAGISRATIDAKMKEGAK